MNDEATRPGGREQEPVPASRVAPSRQRLLGRTATLLRAEVRRREATGRRRRPSLVRTIGRIAFTAIFGILIAVGVVLGVGGLVSLGEPVHWGTFTEERCERARFGCRPIGTWVSDSGDLRVDEVQLDGSVGPEGTARASYRPTGFNNDADNAIVHAEPWATLGPWMPWILVVVFGGVLGSQWWRWRTTP
jgi:hypothetical protein